VTLDPPQALLDAISTTVDLPVGENFPNDDGLDLGGYRVTSSDNIGRPHLSSLEFSYRQNLVFLPGAWKALSVFGNYTRLSFDNYENFRRPHHLGTGGLSFDRRGLSLRWNAAWAPTYRRAAVNATTGFAGGLGTRLTHDAQLSYRFSKLGSFYLNGRNVFNKKQETYYIGGPRLIMTSFNDYGTVWTAGVRGQF
jgi:outer membrane receptor protein involved in Fe transport